MLLVLLLLDLLVMANPLSGFVAPQVFRQEDLKLRHKALVETNLSPRLQLLAMAKLGCT